MDKQKLVEIISKWTKDFPTDCHGDLADAILKQFHVEKRSDCKVVETYGVPLINIKHRGGTFELIDKTIKRVIIVNQSKV